MGSMKDQLGDNLFTYQERMAASRAARDEGMERIASVTPPGWATAMYECIEEVCRIMPQFTADDIFDVADRRRVPPIHDKRAFGPVMMRASRNKLCTKADCAPRPSRRASLHASPLSVWNSALYRGSSS